MFRSPLLATARKAPRAVPAIRAPLLPVFAVAVLVQGCGSSVPNHAADGWKTEFADYEFVGEDEFKEDRRGTGESWDCIELDLDYLASCAKNHDRKEWYVESTPPSVFVARGRTKRRIDGLVKKIYPSARRLVVFGFRPSWSDSRDRSGSSFDGMVLHVPDEDSATVAALAYPQAQVFFASNWAGQTGRDDLLPFMGEVDSLSYKKGRGISFYMTDIDHDYFYSVTMDALHHSCSGGTTVLFLVYGHPERNKLRTCVDQSLILTEGFEP
mgnify:CR=1 FL=1